MSSEFEMRHAPRRIDAHVHFWSLSRGDYAWLTSDLVALHRDFGPDDLLPLLEATEMREAIVVQAAATVEETDFLLGIAEKNDHVSGVVGWVDMESPGVSRVLDRLAQNPYFKGVRPMIQDIADVDWMLKDEQQPAFKILAERQICFDCLVKPNHLDNLLRLLDRHPDLRALIDHGAKPDIASGQFDSWAADIDRLATETNAYCKLSGLISEAGLDWSIDSLRPYFDHLLSSFGPERLIFGSDWPVLTMTESYDVWFKAANVLLNDADETARTAIFGDNAASFYRL